MAKNFQIFDLLDVYGAVLTEKQRFITECYYNDDLSLAEISQNEGITRQAVRDFIKRAEAQMYELESKLGLCEKKRQNAETMNEIISLSEKLSGEGAEIGGQIVRLAETML